MYLQSCYAKTFFLYSLHILVRLRIVEAFFLSLNCIKFDLEAQISNSFIKNFLTTLFFRCNESTLALEIYCPTNDTFTWRLCKVWPMYFVSLFHCVR